MTKAFELTLRLRNNILKQMRLGLGLNMQEMADRLGISYGLYVRCEGLLWCPVGKDAGNLRWKPTATRIAEYFGVSPEDIWPAEVLAVVNPVLVREMSAADMVPMLESQHHGVSVAMLSAAPDEMIATHELAQLLDKYLGELPPREASIVRDRAMHNRQFDEIGRQWNVSRSRAQQIYAQSLEVLRQRGSKDRSMREMLGIVDKPRRSEGEVATTDHDLIPRSAFDAKDKA